MFSLRKVALVSCLVASQRGHMGSQEKASMIQSWEKALEREGWTQELDSRHNLLMWLKSHRCSSLLGRKGQKSKNIVVAHSDISEFDQFYFRPRMNHSQSSLVVELDIVRKIHQWHDSDGGLTVLTVSIKGLYPKREIHMICVQICGPKFFVQEGELMS